MRVRELTFRSTVYRSIWSGSALEQIKKELYLESFFFNSLDHRLQARFLGHQGSDLDLEPFPAQIKTCNWSQQRRGVGDKQPKLESINVTYKYWIDYNNKWLGFFSFLLPSWHGSRRGLGSQPGLFFFFFPSRVIPEPNFLSTCAHFLKNYFPFLLRKKKNLNWAVLYQTWWPGTNIQRSGGMRSRRDTPWWWEVHYNMASW